MMNDVEKKIKARSEARQASTTPKAKATKAKAPKAEPKPKTSKAKTPKAKAPKEDKAPNATQILTTKEVAAMVGTTPKALRRVLRAKWYNDGVTTHYAWTKDDPTLKKILEHYAQKKTGTDDKEKE